MSIRRIAICVTTFIVLATPLGRAQAQHEIHHVPPLIDPDGSNPDVKHPFVDPLMFDPDWQFFAPAEVGEFGGGPDLRTGWFASYARMAMWVSRPQDQFALTQFPTNHVPQIVGSNATGDFAPGTRYELGYMTDEDHGWYANYWRIGGPHAMDITLMERINVFQPLDENNTNFDPTAFSPLRGGGTGGGGGGNNNNATRTFNEGVPAIDANDPITGERSYRVFNSINDAKLSSLELNKTFRWKPLAYGSTIEPFVGFRYVRFQNFFTRQQYDRWDPTTGLPQPGPFAVNFDPTTYTVESLEYYRATFDNHMVGGQFGFRWYKRKSRWNLSSELRAFALQNIQIFTAVDDFEVTYYDDFTVGGTVQSVTHDRINDAGNANEFVFGGEVRADAAFELTRDVSLQFGLNFMELARGVGRGRFLSNNDESVTIFGGNVGVVVNR